MFNGKSNNRRLFIKSFITATVYPSLCFPVGQLFLAEAKAQSIGGDGFVTVDINATGFTVLQNTSNGSKRFAVPLRTSPVGDIIVTRVSASQFYAVSVVCTHAGFNNPQVQAFAAGALTCTHQGSRFAADGTRIFGPAPAGSKLESFPITFDGVSKIKIQIPGIGYTVAASPTPIAAGDRIELIIPTVVDLNYQIWYRTSLTGTESLVSFFTAPTGGTSQTSMAGTGDNVSVFLDRPGNIGLYQVTAQ
jgi:Rieske Fe-S protein